MDSVFEKLFNYDFNIKQLRTYLCYESIDNYIINVRPLSFEEQYRCTIEMV